jgi:hypothetical protein
MSIHIPSTLDEACERLASIEGIMTARNWERAAIVSAFTTNNPVAENRHKIGFRQFAERGLSGLSNHETVKRYHDAWQSAISEGKAKPVSPGEPVEVPDMEWPPRNGHLNEITDVDQREAIEREAEAAGTSADQVARVRKSGAAIVAAIKADPRIAEMADRALDERLTQVQRVEREQRKTEQAERKARADNADWTVEEAYTLAIKHLLNAGIEVRKALRLVTAQARHDGEAVDVLTHSAKDLSERLSMLITFVESGGEVNDAALQAFISGGGGTNE